MWATDMHRLHLLRSGKREGILKALPDSYLDFVGNIDMYRPKRAHLFLELEAEFSPLRFRGIERGWTEEWHHRCKIGERVYNYAYILDVFAGSDEMSFGFHEEKEVGIFKSMDKCRRAYVMPLTKDSTCHPVRGRKSE